MSCTVFRYRENENDTFKAVGSAKMPVFPMLCYTNCLCEIYAENSCCRPSYRFESIFFEFLVLKNPKKNSLLVFESSLF